MADFGSVGIEGVRLRPATVGDVPALEALIEASVRGAGGGGLYGGGD